MADEVNPYGGVDYTPGLRRVPNPMAALSWLERVKDSIPVWVWWGLGVIAVLVAIKSLTDKSKIEMDYKGQSRMEYLYQGIIILSGVRCQDTTRHDTTRHDTTRHDTTAASPARTRAPGAAARRLTFVCFSLASCLSCLRACRCLVLVGVIMRRISTDAFTRWRQARWWPSWSVCRPGPASDGTLCPGSPQEQPTLRSRPTALLLIKTPPLPAARKPLELPHSALLRPAPIKPLTETGLAVMCDGARAA
jgi:hypothetical protein